MVKIIPAGNSKTLDATAIETIDAVIEFYGGMLPQELSDLTHAERPWLDAREGLPPGAFCKNEITHAAMAEYYEALPAA